MPRDNRRIPVPENCVSPNTFKKICDNKSIVDNNGLRCDGRAVGELRPIYINVNTTPAVTGSAYLECGRTKVICSVNGPREVLRKSDFSNTGQLNCDFKFALFSSKEKQPHMPTEEEVDISKRIQEALTSVVLLHRFPKARVDISILILDNDGGAISSAITCAGAALSNAGVEMYDLPIGCSAVQLESHTLIDPTLEEEDFYKVKDFGKITFAMMPAYNRQIIYLDRIGSLSNVACSKTLKDLERFCQQRLADVRFLLQQHVVEEGNGDQLNVKKGSAELKLFQPQKYIETFLENKVRPDARELTSFRPVALDIGCIDNAMGSALVRLGETAVVCGIKAELTNPDPDEPRNGFLVPNVTMSPICSSQVFPGPPAEQPQIYSQMIMDLWKNSSFISPEALCIVEGKLCWCIFVEMTCLNHGGNVLDACVLSMMAALKNLKLPKVKIGEDGSSMEVTNQVQNVKLKCVPFSVTFASFDNGIVADPTSEEETLANGTCSFFLKDNGMIYGTYGNLSKHKFEFVKHAKERCKELKSVLDVY